MLAYSKCLVKQTDVTLVTGISASLENMLIFPLFNKSKLYICVRTRGRPPRKPARAAPLGQHEAPDRRAAPAAPGAVRRARGRVQMQVLPKGTQDSLQRREEAGNEAKVPALRGEDGYHHHQEHVQVPGSGALPASQAAEHQAVHQMVQCLE